MDILGPGKSKIYIMRAYARMLRKINSNVKNVNEKLRAT